MNITNMETNNMNIRARFEEIWPVPEGVYWRDSKGRYGCHSVSDVYAMDAHNIRLDTFTRCQETTDVYVSLIEEMAMEIEGLSIAAYGCVINQSQGIIDRAQNVMEQKK